MIKMRCNACDGKWDEELAVRFGKACDNNCPFCIEKRCGKPAYKFDVDKMIETTLAMPHQKCITIVGGEPLLPSNLENLYKYILAVKNNTDRIQIITSLPKQENFDLYYKILDELDAVIVSFQHYNFKKNNELMCASSKYDRVTALKDLISKYPNKFQAALNLSKVGINDEMSLGIAIQLFDILGIKNLKINELDDEQLWIPITEVEPKLKFKSPYAHGCSINVTRYFKKKYHLQSLNNISCRVRCFIVEPRAPLAFSDMIKYYIKNKRRFYEDAHDLPHKYARNVENILYENGQLSSSFDKKASS